MVTNHSILTLRLDRDKWGEKSDQKQTYISTVNWFSQGFKSTEGRKNSLLNILW